jgi:hypothetical protein
MKIHAVKDKNGKVIATFHKAAAGNASTVTPVLEPGHTVDEIEAPENFHEDLKGFYQKHGR